MPDDLDDLSLRRNWSLWRSCLIHYFSRVSEKSMMTKRKSTSAMLSPCLTETLKGMEVSILPIINITKLSLYILTIADRNLGGQPYLPKIASISWWLDVSKYLTRSAKRTQVGKLWLCLRCRSFFMVNLPSWKPTPGVKPNWYFTLCLSNIKNNLGHKILLKILDPMSINVALLHFWFA